MIKKIRNIINLYKIKFHKKIDFSQINEYKFLEKIEQHKKSEYKYVMNIIRKRKNAIKNMTKKQREFINKKMNIIENDFNDFLKLLKEKKEVEALDKFFFKFEDLPMTGKEYWWFYFAPMNLPKRQMLITFGRGRNKAKIGKHMVRKVKSKNEKECGIVGWLFDKKNEEFVNEKAFVHIGKEKILIDSKTKVEFSGKYPNLKLVITKGKEKICNIKMRESKKMKWPNPNSSFFNGPFGFVSVTFNMEFSGIIKGEKCHGNCNLQKVVGIGPFVPWKWGFIYFKNGSYFSFFKPYISFLGTDYKFMSDIFFYDAIKNKTFYFKDVDIDIMKKDSPLWIIRADNKLLLIVSVYNTNSFYFKKLGKYKYTGNFSLVKEFIFEDGKIKRSLKDTGKGVGILEDAYGFLI